MLQLILHNCAYQILMIKATRNKEVKVLTGNVNLWAELLHLHYMF